MKNEEIIFADKELSVTKESFDKNGGQVLPLLIQPTGEDIDLTAWVKNNKEQFEDDLTKHGGILFRGFGIDTVESFSNFMNCFNTDPLPYMFRSSPRSELNEKIKHIYTSTIYPNERTINMHNESSYSRVWGRKIVFCCLVPAQEGGETPIADSRRVLNSISPELVAKFKAKGVTYRRNLFPDLGMPWQEVFQTNDIEVAKETCRKNNIKYEFAGEDQMIIEWTKPAVYNHPVSGEETWFNHVYFFNKYSRYEELGMEHDDYLPSEYLTSDTFFGDGSEISFSEYQEIGNAYKKNLVIFPYQKGDVLFLDNMLAAHGRNPYKGDRTIATAIIEAAYDTDK
jgi:alpha-ketoglutarate-dependent taurine dioxygenase